MTQALRMYARALAANRWQITGVVLLAGVASLLEGSAIVLLIPIIEAELGRSAEAGFAVNLLLKTLESVGITPDFVNLVAVFAVLAGLSAFATWCSNVAIYWTMTATDARMRVQLFRAVTDLRWTRLSGENAGTIIKALNNDPTQSGVGVHNLLIAGASAISVIAYAAIALLLSWQLTLISVIFAVAVLPAYLWQVKLGRQASVEASAREAAAVARGSESVNNAKLLFAQGLRRFAGDLYAGEIERYRAQKFRQDRLVETARVTFELVAVVFVAGLLLYIAWRDDMSLSAGLVFLAIFYRLAPRIVTFQGCYFRAVNYASWIANWANIVEAFKRDREQHRGQIQPQFRNRLQINHGEFQYPAVEPRAQADKIQRPRGIQGVNFSLVHGEAVAVTGPSGHGKSTLIDVITGLITLDHGEITLDGQSFKEIDVGAWQRQIGLVQQESPLFYGSIRDNITLGEAETVPDRFAQAVRMAEVDEFALRLNDGYDTFVGERGAQLSGGQRQRVALARALYRQPDLLILDEATSALDQETARRVVANLRALKGQMSILIVSHEDTLLGLAERQYRMHEGRLTEVP